MTDASAVLSRSKDELMGRITDEFLERLGRGERPDVEDYACRYPEVASVIRQVFPALELMRLPPADLGPPGTGPWADPGPLAGCLGDFRILGEIGRGGMGIVYEAEQISLARRVALKVLPFAAVLDPRQLQRFKSEAQAAAQLHHTNIVPVYFVGCDRGVHFYAMQLIAGHPLAALIAELRRAAGRGAVDGAEVASSPAGEAATGLTWAVRDDGPMSLAPTASAGPGGSPTGPGTQILSTLSAEDAAGSPEFFRAAAELGVQVADALEHAHQLGVVHRDIKPANLLIDGHGRPWVTDFGLAQIRGDSTLTSTGDLIGTLRYMSPEQALGKRLGVDHRTDIYSLGVTLYELLTLRPPFTATERHELARQIALEEPTPPRRLNKRSPPELEVIILKAMGKCPDDRYATAQELADDLRRFLEDRPIKARRPSLSQRLRSLSRRHRPAVWSAGLSFAASLLMALVVLATSNVLITRERDQKDVALREKDRALRQREAALAVAESNERTARANLGLARKAVDGLYTQLADEMLELPRILPLMRRLQFRHKLLLQGLEFYKEFAAQRDSDPEIRLETGRAYRLAASIQQLLGRHAEAEQALGQAIGLLEPLVRATPGEARYRAELATSHSTLGAILVVLGRFREGVDAYRRATSLLERLVADSPSATDSRVLLAETYRGLGNNPCLKVREAERVLRESIRIYRELAADFPEEARFRNNLATGHISLGCALAAAGRHQEAEASHREALTLVETGDGTAGLARRTVAADAYRELGGTLNNLGRDDDAGGALRRALALYEALSADDPDVAEYWGDQALAQSGLANLHKKAGRLKEEAAGYESALRCYSRLLALSPDDPSYQIPPIGLRCDLARALAAAGQPAEAKRSREQAAELYEKLAPRIAGQAALSRTLRAEFDHQGIRVFLGLGRPREAAGAAERAVALYELLMAESPDFQAFRWRAAVSSHLLGRARIALGRHDAAIETYRKAVALRPDRALFNNDLAWMLVTAPDPGSHNPQEAVRLATRATELDPPAANVWNTLGVARYRAGDYRDAIQALDKAEELGRGREFGFNATFLAMARWQLGEREEARRLYDRAVEWMTKNKPDDDELRQFLAEARVSLQIKVREP